MSWGRRGSWLFALANSWQVAHDLTACSMSLEMFGQYAHSLASSRVFSRPWWDWWSCLSTSCRRASGIMTSCPLKMIPSSIASSSLNDQYGLTSMLYGECFDVVWPSMHYGLHQAVQHGVSLGGFTQLVLFLGCEADEVVLREASLILVSILRGRGRLHGGRGQGMSCPPGMEVWIGCLRGSWISRCGIPPHSHTPGSFVAYAVDVGGGGGGGVWVIVLWEVASAQWSQAVCDPWSPGMVSRRGTCGTV